MKVTVNEDKKESESIYPCLMEYSGGLVVLFLEKDMGLILIKGNSVWEVGEKVEDFGFDGAKGFKSFNGSITLEND